MVGMLRLLIATFVFIAAIYGAAFIWTGSFLPYMIEILGTFGLITLVCLVTILVMKPAGEKD
ncbi:MAG: hypothetical protein AAGJ84_05360 [Pseudomonadota bacterium]